MRKIIGRLLKLFLFQIKKLYFLSISDFCKVSLTSDERLVQLSVANQIFWMRTKTSDLSVLFSCATGEYSVAESILPKSFNGVVVDAGAYIGASTRLLALAYPNATIVAVEASEQNFLLLEKNVADLNNVVCLKMALVPRKKTSENYFLASRETGHWGCRTVSEFEVGRHDALTITPQRLELISLRDISEMFGQIGLLKMDIEGAEKEILLSDVDAVENIYAIVCELHDYINDGCTEAFNSLKNRTRLRVSGMKFMSLNSYELWVSISSGTSSS